MVYKHGVMFATVREDGETVHVAGVEWDDVLNIDVNFVGSDRC